MCPDVVLTDINMPGMTGLEVMRFAKEADPEVCVIVFTGHASTATAIDALRQGAYDYVTKPFDLEGVNKIIKSGLAHRRLKLLNRELIEELRRKNEILQHHEQELRERVRVATAQMTTLYEVGNQISTNLELGPRLAVISQKAAETTGAHGALVFLRRATEGDYLAAAFHGVNGARIRGPGSSRARPTRAAAAPSSAGAALHPSPAASRSGMPRHDRRHRVGARGADGGRSPGDRRARGGRQVRTASATEDEGFLTLFASQSAIAVRNSQLVREHQEPRSAQVGVRGRGLARDPHAAHLGEGRDRAALRRALLQEQRSAVQAARRSRTPTPSDCWC